MGEQIDQPFVAKRVKPVEHRPGDVSYLGLGGILEDVVALGEGDYLVVRQAVQAQVSNDAAFSQLEVFVGERSVFPNGVGAVIDDRVCHLGECAR